MARPQNSARGHFAKQSAQIGAAQQTADSTGNMKLGAGLILSGRTANALTEDASGNFVLPVGLLASAKSANPLTQNSTGFVFPKQVQVGASRYINANSTAFIVTAETAIPSTDQGAAFTLISNSTGVALAVNTTGTTWKYLNVTSVQPT